MCVLVMVPGSTCECHPLSRLARSDAVDVEEHSLVAAIIQTNVDVVILSNMIGFARTTPSILTSQPNRGKRGVRPAQFVIGKHIDLV